jgi:hypothetical protein
MPVDVIVEQVREVREKLIAKYGGLDGWVRHLQAEERKRAREKIKRAEARRSAADRPKTKRTKRTKRKPKDK